MLRRLGRGDARVPDDRQADVERVVEARSDARPYWQMSGVETIVRDCSLSRLAAIGAVRTAQAFGAAAFAPVAGTESATAAPSAAVACRSPAIIS